MAPEKLNTVRGRDAMPLRVLIVVASLDIVGGHSVQATRLLEGLANEPQIEAALLPINPRLPGPLGRLQRIKYVRTVVTELFYLAALLARLPHYDVVHVFSAAYFSFVLAPMPAVLIAKLFGKPVLLNYHSGEAEDHLRRSWLARSVIRLADVVVVPSAYLVGVFARFGIAAQAVFNTVDLSRYGFRARRPLRPVLISNRNLEPLYNVECTLRAFKLVQREMPEARLIVAGDGSQRERLRTLARELQLSQVKFVGRVAPERMPALYDQADVFVNASLIDNMPLSIIEAFAAGLPVVTSDAGGIPYIVENERTGLVVQADDAQALAQAVLRLFYEPGLALRLLSAARADCNRYTWHAVCGDWLRIYQDLTNRQLARGAQRVEAA